jgi:hypothetical protein
MPKVIDESSVSSEQDVKAYVRYLLSLLEELYFENSVLRGVFKTVELRQSYVLHLDINKLIDELRGSKLWEDCHARFATVLSEFEDKFGKRETLNGLLGLPRSRKPN